jgi:hypothetical protein
VVAGGGWGQEWDGLAVGVVVVVMPRFLAGQAVHHRLLSLELFPNSSDDSDSFSSDSQNPAETLMYALYPGRWAPQPEKCGTSLAEAAWQCVSYLK